MKKYQSLDKISLTEMSHCSQFLIFQKKQYQYFVTININTPVTKKISKLRPNQFPEEAILIFCDYQYQYTCNIKNIKA